MTKYKRPVCRGCWQLGNNCKVCERCIETKPKTPTPAHTPLPWAANSDLALFSVNGTQFSICAMQFGWPHQPAFAEAEANADFIVRACNSHYQLVEALQTAAAELEYFVEFARKQCEFEGDAEAGHSAVRNARAALSQAGGE